MSQKETYPLDEMDVFSDERPAQLTQLVMGGIRKHARQWRLPSLRVNLNGLLPSESLEPVVAPSTLPDLDAIHRAGF